MTASLTVAWRSGGSPTIGPVEVCDRDPAKTCYKSHTPWTGVVRDFATLPAPKMIRFFERGTRITCPSELFDGVEQTG